MGPTQINLAAAMRHPEGFRAMPFAIARFFPSDDETLLPEAEGSEAAYLRGMNEGRELSEISHAIEREALLALLASAEAFHHDASADLAAMIALTVERLVGQIVAAAPVDADWLHAQAAAAAAVIGDADRDQVLMLHPDDAVLLADCTLGLAVQSDASMARGNVRIEAGSGWVEAGRSVHLDALHAALAAGSRSA